MKRVLSFLSFCAIATIPAVAQIVSENISTTGTVCFQGCAIVGTNDGSGWLVSSSSPYFSSTTVATFNRKPRVPGATIVQVKASAKLVDVASKPPARYISVAKQIGLKSAATDEAELLNVLDSHFLKIYDFKRVDDYLYNIALKQGPNVIWVWMPLRDADSKTAGETGYYSGDAGVLDHSGLTYGHTVPERVLEDVGCILSEMPDALFLISDYVTKRPDPFMAVTTKKLLQAGKVFIVDQWDEPDFDDGIPSHGLLASK